MQVIILKLTKEEVDHLQEMVHNGWATDMEKKVYYSLYNISEAEASQTTVASWL